MDFHGLNRCLPETLTTTIHSHFPENLLVWMHPNVTSKETISNAATHLFDFICLFEASK